MMMVVTVVVVVAMMMKMVPTNTVLLTILNAFMLKLDILNPCGKDAIIISISRMRNHTLREII